MQVEVHLPPHWEVIEIVHRYTARLQPRCPLSRINAVDRYTPRDISIMRPWHSHIDNRTEVFEIESARQGGFVMFTAAYPASVLPEKNGRGFSFGSPIFGSSHGRRRSGRLSRTGCGLPGRSARRAHSAGRFDPRSVQAQAGQAPDRCSVVSGPETRSLSRSSRTSLRNTELACQRPRIRGSGAPRSEAPYDDQFRRRMAKDAPRRDRRAAAWFSRRAASRKV